MSSYSIKQRFLNARYLLGRLRRFKHAELRHVVRESWKQIQHNTDFLGYTEYQQLRHLADKIIRDRACTVLDVGANQGRFARAIARFCKGVSVVSYEPSRSCERHLRQCEALLPNFIYRPIALSDHEGHAVLNEYNESAYNSLQHTQAGEFEPQNLAVVTEYPIETTTLDAEAERLNLFTSPVFLKVDTQGHEAKVLNGAHRLLTTGNVFAIMIELVTRQHYQNQPLAFDLMNQLYSLGFQLHGIWPVYYEKEGPLTEFDGIFVRFN